MPHRNSPQRHARAFFPFLFLTAMSVAACEGDPAAPALSRDVAETPVAAAPVTILSGPDQETADPAAEFTFRADGTEEFECRLDDGDWTVCRSPQAYKDLPDGIRIFEVRVPSSENAPLRDAARWAWLIDTTPTEKNSTLQTDKYSATADGVDEIVVTLRLRNAYDQPVAGAPVELSVSGSGTTLGVPEGTTGADGIFSTRITSTRAEVKTLSVTSADTRLGVLPLLFTPGEPAAATSALVTQGEFVADGVATLALAATVRDAFGNAVSGVAVAWDATGNGNVFGALSGTTDERGEFATTLASTVAESKTVIADIGEGLFVLDKLVAAAPGLPWEGNSFVTIMPGVTTAGTLATVAVTLADRHGNLTPGVHVGLGASGVGSSFVASEGLTDDAGVFATSLHVTAAEWQTVTATIADGLFTRSAGLLVVSGPPNALQSSLTAVTSTATADGTSAIGLDTRVRDAYGNPVSEVAVSLSATGGDNAFSVLSGTTDSAGRFGSTVVSTVAEAKTIVATVDEGAFSLETPATFLPGPPAAIGSSVTATTGLVLADGIATFGIHVRVRDAYGNPVPGAAVTVDATGDGNTLGNPTGNADADGHFVTTLASTVGDTKTVRADTGGQTIGQVNVTFTPLIRIVLAANGLTVAGRRSDLTLSLEDYQGNLLTDYEGTITLSGSSGLTFPPSVAFTAADGGQKSLSAAVWGVAGQHTLTASWPDGVPTTIYPSLAAGTLGSPVYTPGNYVRGAVTTATFTFTLGGLLPADGLIDLTYPEGGYDLSAVTLEAVDFPDAGTFTLEQAGNTIRLRRNAAAEAPPGTQVTVRLGNVGNPVEPRYYFTETFATRGAAGGLIDTGEVFEFIENTEPWTQPDYPARVRFWVTNFTPDPVLDQLVKFTLPHAPGMTTDFTDLRIVDEAGAVVPHWVQRHADAATATVWARIPEVPVKPYDPDCSYNFMVCEIPYFVYYGNTASADTSAFANAFRTIYRVESDLVLDTNEISADWFEVVTGATLTLAPGLTTIKASRLIVNGNINGDAKGYVFDFYNPPPGQGLAQEYMAGGGSYGGEGGIFGGENRPPYGSRTDKNIDAGSPGGLPEGLATYSTGPGGAGLRLDGTFVDVHANIDVDGGDGSAWTLIYYLCTGGGSGGGVLILGDTVNLSGTAITARGGRAGSQSCGAGAGGRIKVFGRQVEGSYTADVNGSGVDVTGTELLDYQRKGGSGTTYQTWSAVSFVLLVEAPERF